MLLLRSFILFLSTIATASACSCVGQGIRKDFLDSAVVFRGVVTEVKPLPLRSEHARDRYAVTFSVFEYWKGEPAKQITLYIQGGGTDCIGAEFEQGDEYIVFATAEKADDVWVQSSNGPSFYYGWLDVLPKGTRILTANEACGSTGPVKQSRKALRALGKGRKPTA